MRINLDPGELRLRPPSSTWPRSPTRCSTTSADPSTLRPTAATQPSASTSASSPSTASTSAPPRFAFRPARSSAGTPGRRHHHLVAPDRAPTRSSSTTTGGAHNHTMAAAYFGARTTPSAGSPARDHVGQGRRRRPARLRRTRRAAALPRARRPARGRVRRAPYRHSPRCSKSPSATRPAGRADFAEPEQGRRRIVSEPWASRSRRASSTPTSLPPSARRWCASPAPTGPRRRHRRPLRAQPDLRPHHGRGARRATDVPLDAHLMIDDPDPHAPAYVEAGTAAPSPSTSRPPAPMRLAASSAPTAPAPAWPGPARRSSRTRRCWPARHAPGDDGGSRLRRGRDPRPGVPKIRTARAPDAQHGVSTWLQVDAGRLARDHRRCTEAGADVFVAGSAVYSPDDPDAMVGDRVGRAARLVRESPRLDHRAVARPAPTRLRSTAPSRAARRVARRYGSSAPTDTSGLRVVGGRAGRATSSSTAGGRALVRDARPTPDAASPRRLARQYVAPSRVSGWARRPRTGPSSPATSTSPPPALDVAGRDHEAHPVPAARAPRRAAATTRGSASPSPQVAGSAPGCPPCWSYGATRRRMRPPDDHIPRPPARLRHADRRLHARPGGRARPCAHAHVRALSRAWSARLVVRCDADQQFARVLWGREIPPRRSQSATRSPP